jgi:hypothetical protein
MVGFAADAAHAATAPASTAAAAGWYVRPANVFALLSLPVIVAAAQCCSIGAQDANWCIFMFLLLLDGT